MNRTQSQPDLLYESEAIRALHRKGGSLECTDEEGKTPLISACMDSALLHVAKSLIELGANVNAYCPGTGNQCWVAVVPYSEEPLKLEIMIYPTQQDSQPRTVIDLWKSEIEEPTFDQWTRCRLASAIENDKQQLQRLYSACRGIPQVEPHSVLSDTRTSSLDASQPTSEALNLAMLSGASVQSEAVNTNGWGNSGDSNSYNGWGTSLGAIHSLEENTNRWMDKPVKDDYNGWGLHNSKPVDQLTENNLGSSGDDSSSYNGWGTSLGAKHSSEVNTNGWMNKPAKDDYSSWGLLDSKSVDQFTENVQSHENNSPIVPSAPPIPDEVLSEGSIHYYPSINSSALLDMPVPSMVEAAMTNSRNNGARDSSCAICSDASTEGACIPCGHMAGCMPCLNEIKVNKGVCPICLTKIDQVVRLYAV